MVSWWSRFRHLAIVRHSGTILLSAGALQAPVVRVRVQGDGRPLSGARISLDTLDRRADRDGVALFPATAGSHRLVVTAVGWRPDSLTVTLAAARDTAIVVELEPVPAELEELVVATTRSPRRVEDEPLRVEVLETEEIEEKLLMTPGDVVMLLNETGGARAQTANPSLGGAAIRIRGLRGRYTQILADGLPLFGERAGAFGPLQIPPMDLGQVEIVKGAASALFGGSALGGLVNLISRAPEPATRSLLNATTLGGLDAVVFTAGRPTTSWGYTLLAGGHRQGRRDRDGDGWTDVPGYSRAVARPRLFWRDERGQSLFLTAGATVEDRSGGTLPGAEAPDGLPFAERLETTRLDLGLAGRWRAGGRVWLQVRATGVSLDHDHRFGTVLEPDRHRTWFGEAALSTRRGGTDLLIGAAVVADRYRSDSLPGVSYRHTVPALFAQVERGGETGGVAASFRLDHHNVYGAQASPRLSALVRTGGGWSVRMSLGAGFYGPTPLTDETERTGLARLVLPGGLRAERAVSASLDVDGVLGPVELVASGFSSRISRAVQLRSAPGGGVELVNASGPTWSTGADLTARYRRGALGITTSYAFVRATEPDLDGPGKRPIPLTPRHTAGMVGTYEGDDGRIGIELYYTGGQLLEPNPYRASGTPFLLVGLLVERRVGRARAFLNFENLTDVRQTRFDPLVLPARATDGRWTIDAWAPLDGRVVNGGVRLDW